MSSTEFPDYNYLSIGNDTAAMQRDLKYKQKIQVIKFNMQLRHDRTYTLRLYMR